jgi:hypothetical protein
MSIKVAAYCRVSTNEKYCGLDNSLKYDTGEVFNKNSYPIVKAEYKVKDTDKIPDIIPHELFEQCKNLMHSKVNYKNQCGIYNGNSKYKNFIYYYLELGLHLYPLTAESPMLY